MKSTHLALITGGQGDLAQAAASALRQRGWQVLSPSKQELDVTQAGSVADFCEGLSHLDYLICAAGLVADAPLARMREEDWERVWQINFLGAQRCARACWPLLAASQGCLAFVGSHAGAQGRAGQVAYATAKAALGGLTQVLAQQGARQEVRVNLVLPGFLETKMTAAMADKHREKLRGEHLLGKFNSVESAAEFLAQLPSLQHTSGQSFALDSRPI